MIDTDKLDVKRCFKQINVKADIIVVGGGVAGISAALMAAREGKKTVLITDRPILGGSASSEVRVGPGGAAATPFNRFARETGIIEEIFNHIYYKAENAGKWRWFYFDQIYFDLAMKEENLTIYLNTTIYDAKTNKNNVITSILGLQLRAETKYDFSGKYFIDCTGDGTLGYLAGATFRMGREEVDEFNEVYSPKQADKKTMGASLLFTTIDAKKAVTFKTPKWAIDIESLPSYERINKSIRCMPDGSYYGFWWVEYGGDLDSIHDDGEIILHLRKLVNGLWGYIKNSGKFKDVENQELNWIGYLPGKRESRRLIGPYIVNANDMTSQKHFDDAIGYTGWPIDIHPPKGYLAKGAGCTHDFIPGITDIPYRCLYSKNISNLFFAGRDISCTHEALGTLRLISTTSVMGQAVAMAASMCIDFGKLPNDIYNHHLITLQQKLLKSDQSIIGKTLIDENDYAKKAKISVSSEKATELVESTQGISIDKSMGIIIPVEKNIDDLSFLLESEKETSLTIDCYISDDNNQNYRAKSLYSTKVIAINKLKWYTLPLDMDSCPGQKLIIMIRPNKKVTMHVTKQRLTSVLGIQCEMDILSYDTYYHSLLTKKSEQVTPCFKTSPLLHLYQKEMLVNGHIRPFALPNSWISEKMKVNQPEWIKFSFEKEIDISMIHLVFNSNLNPRRVVETINKVNEEMIKHYEVIVKTDKGELVIIKETDNFNRFRIHQFEKIKTKEVMVKLYRTWGSHFAEVFDVRIYE